MNAEVGTSASRSAVRRRALYQGRLADAVARPWRSRFWIAAGWLASEGRRLSVDGQERLLARVVAIAEELNERSSRRDVE